ncbi:MAG: hypothetical protein NTX94_06540 [Caldiserica bacterium]|nr:hypothetical protein [Caldisericota bacterium]
MDDKKLYTLSEAHEEFARQLNGEVWELLDATDRSSVNDERMLYAAWASAYHWLIAGTAVHHQRAEWLLSRVYTVLGDAPAALAHARRCMELTEKSPGEMAPFDLAYACEAIARASALAGDGHEATRYLELARESGTRIINTEDRQIFEGDLKGGDWFGIT